MRVLPDPNVFEIENRSAVRQLCRWRSILHVKPFPLSGFVEDFSAGGCRMSLKSTKTIEIGDYVVIDIIPQNMILDGEVRWKRDTELGVRFLFGDMSRNKQDF